MYRNYFVFSLGRYSLFAPLVLGFRILGFHQALLWTSCGQAAITIVTLFVNHNKSSTLDLKEGQSIMQLSMVCPSLHTWGRRWRDLPSESFWGPYLVGIVPLMSLETSPFRKRGLGTRLTADRHIRVSAPIFWEVDLFWLFCSVLSSSKSTCNSVLLNAHKICDNGLAKQSVRAGIRNYKIVA